MDNLTLDDLGILSLRPGSAKIGTPSTSPSTPTITSVCPTTQPHLGIPYTFRFRASGGQLPLTWAITSGSLPTGISLHSSTGLISGVATAPGTYAYTAQVSDSTSPTPQAASISCTATVTSGYTAIGTITIDHTLCGSSIDTANYPFLFNSTNNAFKMIADGGYVTSPSGFDTGVFFLDSALSIALDYEVEYWNPVTGQYVAWVKLDNLSITANTVIYVGIGNPALTGSVQNVHGTWDDNGLNYFKLVQHAPDGTTLSLADSTSNANDGVNSGGVTAAAGQLDGGVQFVAGSSQRYTIPNNSGIQCSNTDQMTWEFWCKSGSTALQILLSNFNADDAKGYQFWADVVTSRLRMWIGDGVSSGIFNSGITTDICNNFFGRIMITYNGSGLNTGLNASINAIPETLSRSDSLVATSAGTADLQVGGSVVPVWSFGPNNAFFGNSTTNPAYWDGLMDEIRISKGIVRSADYDTACYNNQSDPSTFYGLVVAEI